MSEHILLQTSIMKQPEGKAQLFGRAFASIYWQRWKHGRVDHFMPSGDDNYWDSNGTVTRKAKLGQEKFLQGDYSHYASIEYDMIVPDNALEQLRELDVDIAYGFYVFRHMGKRYWNVANRIETLGAAWLCQNPDQAKAAWGHVVKCQGCGLGITLIKRHVMEAIPFRNWKGVSNDWALAYDAKDGGYSQACDTRIICGHMSLTPSPQILWPDINEESLYRQEFIS